MTTVPIIVLNSCTQEASQAGMFAPDKIESSLRQRLRIARI